MNAICYKTIRRVKELEVIMCVLWQVSSLNLPSDLVPTCLSQALKTKSFIQ